MENNRLAQEFNTASLLRFTMPAMVMLLFMSLYQMVDAVFVSNFVSEDALSALNIVFPLISFVIAVSIMLATGGSAVIAKTMGEGDYDKARKFFSMIVAVGVVFGIIVAFVGTVFTSQLIHLLGSTPQLDPYCYDYLFILMMFTPFSVLQMLFQTFFVTTGKPNLGLASTILAGIANIFFDYLFIIVMGLGVKGAALGTVIGYCIPAVFGLIFFAVDRNGSLYFVLPSFNPKVLGIVCSNGASEMVTNLSNAITTLAFNFMMLKYIGESGVAAITIALYAQFFLTAVYMGFSGGIAPIISYNYGSRNNAQLHRLFVISIRFITVSSVAVFAFALLCGNTLISVFVRPETEVFEITSSGFRLFATSFIFAGMNIFSSGMFTAFSDGKVSAIISFMRTFVFLLLSLFILPLILGVDGVWLAIPVAEALTMTVTVYYFVKLRKVYHY